ncbi:hypothetical protein MKZ08_14745 [Viridibacillus sp. FSL R5-0477]|uniref:hypothetical protein n=1 Tax=Viridibacillus TaxID=496496 RepID=UPI00096E82B1|nr:MULTISPECIES: hypothetical protein [Viridibacillus]OMC83895.1 hypothetical protein BK130_05110 [Viridibacillus sp. FSL H8-0123]OMC88416.1 hypothetical protein BK128_00230 [Viridibacillus sp. FSL H7-0596]OMC93055.1 hypothetical protein BK137_00550 [Viridibacillus arenosi]
MKKIIVGLGLVLLIAYISRELYATFLTKSLYEVTDSTFNTGIIDEQSLDYMLLVEYPTLDLFETRDKQQVQQFLEQLLQMEVRAAVLDIKETEKHYKLVFRSDENDEIMTFILYDNKYAEMRNQMGVIGSTAYIRTVDNTFFEQFYPLLSK